MFLAILLCNYFLLLRNPQSFEKSTLLFKISPVNDLSRSPAFGVTQLCKNNIDIVSTITLNQRCKGFIGSDPSGKKYKFI